MAWMILALTLACGPVVEIEVLSPAGSEPYFQGVPVLLDALVTADGLAVGPTPTWEVEGWSFEGNGVSVDDLPLGDHELRVRARWERGVGEATVPLRVVEPPPDPVPFEGTLDVTADITSPFYTGAIPCVHRSLSLLLHPTGALEGQGVCDAAGERLIWFEGLVSGATLTGRMRLDGQEEDLAFTGAREGDTLTAAFDGTFTAGQGSMRLHGSFAASAVAP